MRDFSTADGFLEVIGDLSDMINLLANEPSVGLLYIQQHTHNSTANLLSLETNVLGKSHETFLHTEDLEDSIIMLGSMKECGFPIVDEMIKEIKRSVSIITHSPSSGFLGQAGSWSPATWGQNSLFMRLGGEGSSSYMPGIFRSAVNFKGAKVEMDKESSAFDGEGISTDLDPMVATSPESCLRIMEAVGGEEDFPVSRKLGEESGPLKENPHQILNSLHEEKNDEFRANRES